MTFKATDFPEFAGGITMTITGLLLREGELSFIHTVYYTSCSAAHSAKEFIRSNLFPQQNVY